MELHRNLIIAQVINFGILFFLFKKFLSTPLSDALTKRRVLVTKLENADQEYDKMLSQAHEKAEHVIHEAINKKNDIMAQAGAVAENKQKEIIENAHSKANMIIKTAEEKSRLLEQEFEYNFERGVKQTTEIVVRKLLNQDTQLQQEYINSLVKEATSKSSTA